MNYDIFISYRRKGGYETAKHLFDLLTRDGYKVSFDIDTLRNGDFDLELLKRIDECTDFILILNKGAFDRIFDSQSDPQKDWLRNELAYALKKGKNIIPVMLNGFTEFPDNLPDDIARVQKKNGPKYDQYYFDDFYRRLKEVFMETPQPDGTAVDATIRNLKVSADTECTVYVDEKPRETIQAGKLHVFPLAEGTYKVEFVSAADEAVRIEKIIELEDCDRIERIELLPLQRLQDERRRLHDLQQTAVALFERYEGPVVWPDGPCDKRYPYAQRGFLIAREGKYGVATINGKELIPCRYDEIRFTEGLYIVVEEKRYGCIDRKGDLVVRCEYDQIRPMGDNGLLPAMKKSAWGYIDQTGAVVIDFTYTNAMPFVDGVAAVAQDYFSWGLIDDRNNLIVEPVYKGINYPTWRSEGLIPVDKNGKWGFIDKNGRYVLQPKYKQIWIPFENGVAVVETTMNSCFIDRSGKTLSKIKTPMSSGDFYVYLTDGLLPLCKGNRLGYIDAEGKEVIPLQYDHVEEQVGIFVDGFLRISKNGKWGYIDRQNKTLLDFIYDAAGDFNDGIAHVVLDGTDGFIDREGHFMAVKKQEETPLVSVQVSKEDYERYILQEAELERFTFDDRIGYKDSKSGKVVVEAQYHYGPERLSAEQQALVFGEKNAKIIDKLGNTIETFDRISAIEGEYLYVSDSYYSSFWLWSHYKPAYFLVLKPFKDKGRYYLGVIDLHGRTVVPFQYREVVLDHRLSVKTGELALIDDEKKIDIWSLPLERRIPKSASKLLKKMRRKNLKIFFLSIVFLALIYGPLLSPYNLLLRWNGLSILLKIITVAVAAAGLTGAVVQIKKCDGFSGYFIEDKGLYPIPIILFGSLGIYWLATLSGLSQVLYWLRIGGYVLLGSFILTRGILRFRDALKVYRHISK